MKEKRNRHIVDILFVLALFGIFVISAIFLISIGANIYSDTVSTMDDNFNSRTAVAYIVEKIHQTDEANCLSIGKFDENPAIIITSNSNGKEYTTYIYEYDGALRELTARNNLSLAPEAGQPILELDSFNIDIANNNLIHCSIKVNDDEDYGFNISLHSKGGSDEE